MIFLICGGALILASIIFAIILIQKRFPDFDKIKREIWEDIENNLNNLD